MEPLKLLDIDKSFICSFIFTEPHTFYVLGFSGDLTADAQVSESPGEKATGECQVLQTEKGKKHSHVYGN